MESSLLLPTVGPFTTTFIPPAYCDSVIAPAGPLSRDVSCSGDLAFPASDCFPGGGRTSSSRFGDGPIAYSPASVCPVGWSIATGISGSSNSQTIRCCPLRYSYISDYPYGSCTSQITWVSNTATVNRCSGSTMVTTIITKSAYYTVVWAKAIQLEVGSAATMPIFTPTDTMSPAKTTQSTQPIQAMAHGEPKLAGGAIAGIVVGAIAAIAIIIVCVLLCLNRRRQQTSNATPDPPGHNGSNLPELVTAEHTSSHFAGPQALLGNMTTKQELGETTYPEPIQTTQLNNDHTVELHSNPTLAARTAAESPQPSPPHLSELHSSNLQELHAQNLQELHAPSPTSPPAYTSSLQVTPAEHHPNIYPQLRGTTPSPPHIRSPYTIPTATSTATNAPIPVANRNTDPQIADLEASKALLEERMARMRHLSQMEEEHARLAAEIERLRRK